MTFEVHDLYVSYGVVEVVRAVSLHVEPGEVVVLLGANGAGKTTTMLALGGVLPSRGTVTFEGAPLRGPLHRRVRRGIGFITEARGVFPRLTTRTNLALGRGGVDGALRLFPELKQLLDRPAGLLSGGEQQMVTLGRSLAAKPQLLLIDELSLGLAPLIVRRLLVAVRAAADGGVGVLLVEQHARQALNIADRGYVMRRGAIELEGSGAELVARLDEIGRTYLGVGDLST